jgi:hypothetical protein
MLLLMIDAFILSGVILATFLVVRGGLRKNNERKLEQAIFRQKVAEDLAKQVDQLNADQILEHEKKIQEKLQKLQ